MTRRGTGARRSGDPRKWRSTGVRVEARHRYHGQVPTPALGEHLWVMTGAWRIARPETILDPSGTFHLDMENLLTLDGPGCWVCEQVWSPEVAALPCPGDPSGLL